MKKIIIFTILLLFFVPSIVHAAESYKLTIDDYLYNYDTKNGGSRNFVTLDCFLYYSFYDAKGVTLTKDGKNFSMILPANKYTSKNKMASATINMPQITFKGIEKISGKTHTIELTGTIGGKPTSNIVYNSGKKQNYTFSVTKIEMDISYDEGDVKNGKVTADAEMYFSYTESEDLDNRTTNSDDEKSYYVTTFEISGLDGKGAAAVATTNNTAKNTTTKTNTTTKANTTTTANTTAKANNTVKENTAKEAPVASTTTDNTTEENNEFPVGPVVGGTAALIAVGGGIGLAIRHGNAKVKTVKDSVTGEEKNYIYNDDTGEYESEDGTTILNTSMEDEIEKQKIKDREFMREQHEKLVNRETQEDMINKKMAEDMRKGEKELDREIYIDKIGSKNGIRSTNKDDIRKGLEKIQEKNMQRAEESIQKAKNFDTAVSVAEGIEEAADIAITIGETAVPGGKAVSATYKAVKGVAATAAEHGMDKAKLANAAIKGLADAGTTYMSGIGKAATTVGGEVAGDVTEAVMEGKSAGEVWDSAKDATVKGVTKATVNATADALGDVVGEETANVGGYLYQKHVADPKLDANLKKGKGKK